jgi:SAM-dependent methyltransferase
MGTFVNSIEQLKAAQIAGSMRISEERIERDLFRLRCLLGPMDLRNKNVLEIGCGRGIYCYLMALGGAGKSIGIEPEADGCTNGIFHEAIALGDRLELPQVQIRRMFLDDFNLGKNGPFDIILANNVVNHLDEKAVILLHKNEEARNVYVKIFKNIYSALSDNAVFIIADCSRHNIFSGTSRLGLFKGFCFRTIEWQKHQSPAIWRLLLKRAGFIRFELEYWVPYVLRDMPWLANNIIFSYLTHSHFTLRAWKA